MPRGVFVRSPEYRAKMAAATRSAFSDPALRAGRSARLLGNRRRAGRAHSAEVRQRIADWWTPERRARQAAVMAGRVMGTGPKIAASLTARYARRPMKTPKVVVIGECVYCGAPATTVDHVIPRELGGSDEPENRVPACRPCNSSKWMLTLEEWFGVASFGPAKFASP